MKTIEELLKEQNECRGSFIETPTDLSPDAILCKRLMEGLKEVERHTLDCYSKIQSFNNVKNDLAGKVELF